MQAGDLLVCGKEVEPCDFDGEAITVSMTNNEADYVASESGFKNKTGVCWTKSCLLSALLRAHNIPSGISYQLLTRADDDSEGHMIHALNTVYIEDLPIRPDAILSISIQRWFNS